MTSAVLLRLDTKPPVLQIVAQASVEPPDEWVVEVTSNEPLGDVRMVVSLADGQRLPVGFETVDPHHLVMRLPTVGIPGGPVQLEVIATDGVCNTTIEVIETLVLRPHGFEVLTTVGRAWNVDTFRWRAWVVESELWSQ